MQRDEYSRMADAEAVLWWYRALHANLAWLLEQYAPEGGRVLDAGCGTGGFLRHLAERPHRFALVGLDIHPEAAAAARDKSGVPVAVGSVVRMPFRDASFTAMLSADVLYHRMVDPSAALPEAFRCLAPGGVLIANVPAYQWLRSYHDDTIHTARRFTRRQITALLAEADFSVPYCTYWNSLLFPLMVIRRKLLPAPKEGSDVVVGSDVTNRLFRTIASAEHGLMRLGIRFPFGGSCLVVGVKNG